MADSLTTPIVQTSTYTFKDTAQLIAFQVRSRGSQPAAAARASAGCGC